MTDKSRGVENLRPSWDAYFMEITRLVSTRSTCLRRKVGAVMVMDKRILATGYNGVPKNLPHCLDIGCLREKLKIPSGERHELCRGLHAEQNAIIQAATSGTNLSGCTLYVTHFPCSLCIKMILNSSIRQVLYLEGYSDDLSKQLALEGALDIRRVETKPGETVVT
jgi:dCMP deaminase